MSVGANGDFNSIKVQLKQLDQDLLGEFDENFNSIKVQLKLSHCVTNFLKSMNFNSIKVQLKHFCFSAIPASMLFQFHKGTIKTNTRHFAGYGNNVISIP